jgi:hypothetical protein
LTSAGGVAAYFRGYKGHRFASTKRCPAFVHSKSNCLACWLAMPGSNEVDGQSSYGGLENCMDSAQRASRAGNGYRRSRRRCSDPSTRLCRVDGWSGKSVSRFRAMPLAFAEGRLKLSLERFPSVHSPRNQTQQEVATRLIGRDRPRPCNASSLLAIGPGMAHTSEC